MKFQSLEKIGDQNVIRGIFYTKIYLGGHFDTIVKVEPVTI